MGKGGGAGRGAWVYLLWTPSLCVGVLWGVGVDAACVPSLMHAGQVYLMVRTHAFLMTIVGAALGSAGR